MRSDAKEDSSSVEGGDFRAPTATFGSFEISKEGFFHERGRSESMSLVLVCAVLGSTRIEPPGRFSERFFFSFLSK